MCEEEVPKDEKEKLIKKVMKERYEALGPMTAHELSVFVCFVTVIVLWFFRRPLFMPGELTKFAHVQLFIRVRKKGELS